MVDLRTVRRWRWCEDGHGVEVYTDATGWVLYSTGPHVEGELAELREADIPQNALTLPPPAPTR
jgi:hypothetical protein